jgi:hypothetical protein
MKSLKRPMFKRGGGVSAKNNGIVQGFDNGGSVLEDFRTAGLIKDIEKPRGLTTSDYLRIAAAGAQIMGAQPTGRSGFIGALQAASPALAGLGTDLATSSDARQAAYQDRLSNQDALIAQGIIADRDKLEKQFILEQAPILRAQLAAAETEADKQAIIDQLDALFPEKAKSKYDELQEARTEGFYNFQDAAQRVLQKIQDGTATQEEIKLYGGKDVDVIAIEMAIANVLEDYKYMAEGGKVEMAMSDPSPEAERGDMLDNLARKYFKKPLSKLSDDEVIELEEMMDEMPLKLSDGGSTRAGDNEEKAAEDRMKMESGKFYIDEDGNLKRLPTKKPRQNTRPGMNEEIAADAARRAELNKRYGRAEGGTMTEAPQAPKESPLTFEELRARLPREVTDQVVRLLATSEAALLDFANIDTEQDIAIFNQKYNADLQLPTQVA